MESGARKAGISFHLLRRGLFFLLPLLLACQGGKESSNPSGSTGGVQVTLALEVSETNALDTVGVTANVSGSTNTALSWAVDGVANGNATVGTLSGSGTAVTYTAPATAGTHTITATSQADLTKQASAPIQVKTPPMAVSVSPATVNVVTGGSLSLTATVSASRHPTVTWTVDGIANGNATVGALTGSGNTVTYAAPAAAGTHTITATSTANPSVQGHATLTVQAPLPIEVTLTPSSATLDPRASIGFTATVTNATNPAVSWSVDGVANGNATVGTLTGSGNTATYTAPSTAGTHTVKATSVQDPTRFATAEVAVRSGSPVDLGPLAAFPGCEGMGCGATGGRGGDVYTVNTLEDTTNPGCVPQNGPNGPTCSLRDAMTKSGPRTIVFSVGGTITLRSPMWLVNRDMTIAGQTAPGGGIQIRGDGSFGTGGAMLWLNGNSIVRYIRIRPGNAPLNSSYQGLAGLAVSKTATDDVVIDHNSFQWDSNKPLSWWSDNGVRRGTVSWNLFAESLDPHSTGPLIGGQNMGQANMDESSWDGHHNVLATFDHRLPQTWVKHGRWINNFVGGYLYAMLIRGGTQFDIIGNVWDGMNYGIKADRRHEVRWADTYENNANQIVPSGTAQIYMHNNFGPHNPLGTLDNFTTMLRRSSGENGELVNAPVVESTYKAPGPTILASLNRWPITITPLNSIEDLKTLLTPTVGAYRRLGCDGAWVESRDSADARIIGYIRNPATSPTSYVSTAGPYPTLAPGTPCTDSDGDGMPDPWEDAHGLDKHHPADRNVVRPNARGYTNLELYLSGLFPNGTPLP